MGATIPIADSQMGRVLINTNRSCNEFISMEDSPSSAIIWQSTTAPILITPLARALARLSCMPSPEGMEKFQDNLETKTVVNVEILV